MDGKSSEYVLVWPSLFSIPSVDLKSKVEGGKSGEDSAVPLEKNGSAKLFRDIDTVSAPETEEKKQI